jgi:hypothetical protein
MAAIKGPKTQDVNASGAISVEMAGEAVTPADGVANAGVEIVDESNDPKPLIVMPMVFNGATWDRLPGSAGGLTAEVQGLDASATPATARPVMIGAEFTDDSPPALNAGDVANLQVDDESRLLVAGPAAPRDLTDAEPNSFQAPVAEYDTPISFPVYGLNFDGAANVWKRVRGNESGLFVQGNITNDAADSGNPVKIGGKASIGGEFVADGDRVDAWFNQGGALHVAGFTVNPTDATANELISLNGPSGEVGVPVGTMPFVYNGATWDRLRGTTEGVGLRSTAVSFGDTVSTSQATPVNNAGSAIFQGVFPYVFNGTNWDRLRGDTNGLAVRQLTAANNAADNLSNTAQAFHTTSGQLIVNPNLPYVFNGATWDRTAKASATARIPTSAATNNAANIKASSGTVYEIYPGLNTTAGIVYAKIFNTAGAPNPAVDVPVLTIPLNALGAANSPLSFPTGLYFSTGISIALVTGAADGDNTAVGAGAVVGLNVAYS